MNVPRSDNRLEIPNRESPPAVGGNLAPILAGAPPWYAVNASVSGSSHERAGQPGQDASGFRRTHNGILLAVSDGAGSASHGGAGSRQAVAVALDCLYRHRWQPAAWAIRYAMAEARRQVIRLAQSQDRRPRQYAATLALAVVRDDRLYAAQTGDGAISWGDAAGNYGIAAMPQRGEYANTTHFITDRNWQPPAVTTITTGNGVSRLMLTTDGMLDLAMIRRSEGIYEPFEPFHNTLFGWLESRAPERTLENYLQLRGLLHSPKTRARTDDDCTLIVASALTGTTQPSAP